MACQPFIRGFGGSGAGYIRRMLGPGHRHALALSVCVLLAACAQAPEYRRPAVELPDRWTVAAAEDAPAARQVDWREFFADPRLRRLIGAALDNNRDMRQAVARVEEARAQFGVIEAERLPTINTNFSRSASRTPATLFNSRTDLKNQRYDLSLSMTSFEVDFWGRVASLNDAAKATFLATEEARRALRISLISDVANGYFALLQYDEIIDLYRRTVATRERSRDLVVRAQDAGAASRLEQLQVDAALENARAELAAFERQRAISEHALNYLVGGQPGDLPMGLPIGDQRFDRAFSAGLPAEAILERPDVLAAEQRLIAANASIGVARAAFLPRIVLTAGLGIASPALAALFAGSNDTWNFQPSLSAPLFDAGRTQGNVDLATARKNIAVADYEKTIQQAFRDISDLLAAQGTLKRQVGSAQAVAGIQSARVEAERARHQAGAVSLREVLDAEREAISARQTLAQLQFAQLTVTTQLYKALGGGTLE